MSRTEALHTSGNSPSKPRPHSAPLDGAPLVEPLVLSTTYCQVGLSSNAPHRYSRESNPTVDALERALGDLEDAPPALAFTTGLAAETALFHSVLKAGDHVVCSAALYGGTTRLLRSIFAPLGVTSSFVDSSDLEAVRRALRKETRLLFVETPANPTLVLSDLRALAALAREHQVLFAVDNTFLTPILQRPLDLGADLSVTSTTKFVEGHSAALGGAIVTRDPELRERIFFVRKCTGAIQSPFQAWLTLQGSKTLALRIQRQSSSALQIAEHLSQHAEIERVFYPALDTPAVRRLAQSQHLGADGAVVSFEVRGGAERARALLLELRHCRLVEHVGSVETLITHSASMTHAGVPREERERIGISESLLRLSVGIEDVAVIKGDLETALAATRTLRHRAEVPSCA